MAEIYDFYIIEDDYLSEVIIYNDDKYISLKAWIEMIEVIL